MQSVLPLEAETNKGEKEMNSEGIFSSFKVTLTGLMTQIKKLDTISQNVANADRAPDKAGNIYHKKIVLDHNVKKNSVGFDDEMVTSMKRSRKQHLQRNEDTALNKKRNDAKIEVIEIEGEKQVYNPLHPRADKNGYVNMPNVNMVEEMVDLMSASRAYEANLSVMQAAKQMAKKTLKI